MTFKVVIVPSAESDISEYADFIAQDSTEHAARWVADLISKLESLSENP